MARWNNSASRGLLLVCLTSLALGACWYDKFTKGDEPPPDDDGSGGRVEPSSGGQGGEGNEGGDTGSGGAVVSDTALAVEDEEFVTQGDEIVFDLLANDSGPGITFVSANDDDATRPSSLSAATFSVSSRGVLTFEPAPAFWGTYRATYVIEDENGVQSTGSVTIHVAPTDISVATIEAGWGGIVIQGAAGDFLGSSISAAGDTNGDGVDDFLIGAPGADTVAGRVALVMGDENLANLNLSTDVSDAVQIFDGTGTSGTRRAGASVSRAGRVNDDALSDIIIGASNAGERGRAYVIYGSPDFPGVAVTLNDTPEASDGFTIDGNTGDVAVGLAVSGGGDLDGDASDDVSVYLPQSGGGTLLGFLGTSEDTPLPRSTVIGLESPAPAFLGDLFDADGRSEILAGSTTDVILLRGAESWPANSTVALTEQQGWKVSTTLLDPPQVSTAGLFDDDDRPDLAYCDPAAFCMVVSTPASVDDVDLGAGWEIGGFAANGPRLSGGGDLNADGLDDLIFAENTQAYVVYGQATLPTSPLDVTTLSSAGFSIDPNGHTISKVALLGDVNGDDLVDYALTVPNQDADKGRVYVIFGTRTE